MAVSHYVFARPKGRRARRASQTVALSAALLLTPFALHAQGTTATLNGTVTDPTGAVIPNAAVTLRNQATGDIREGKSNGSGDFSFSAVPVGDYEVDIKTPGFEEYKASAIHLDPGDQRSLREIKLVTGAETQSVSVNEASQSITLDSGEQSSLISAQDIQHLSVEGRDVTELLKVLPGFAITGNAGGGLNQQYDPSQVQIGGALGAYAGAGNNVNETAILSDGADVTDPGNFGSAFQNINYEQVAEVKVQTASFTADEARGPIVINAVGKSGGDRFHGSLYTYARTYQLDSADWLSNFNNQLKPPDREVYPGFTLGGPIYVPRLDFNKNKRLTFFVGAEDYAQRNAYAYGSAGSAILSALVPTANMRTGNFSQAELGNYLGSAITSSTFANISSAPVTGLHGEPLTNGQLLTVDPQVKALLNTMPLPNIPSANGLNYTTTNLTDNDLWQARGRIDYAVNDSNKLFIVYSKETGKQGFPQVQYYSPRGALGGVNIPGGGLLSTINSEIGSLNYTTIVSPTITNEAFVAGAYLLQNFTPKNFAATTANGAYTYGGLFNNGSKAIPEFQDYGDDGLPLNLETDGSFGGVYAKKFVRTAGDNLTKVFGKHTVRIGVFGQLDTNKQVTGFLPTNGAVQLYFFPETATDPVQGALHWTGAEAGGGGNGGNYLANFLEGGVFNYNQTNLAPTPNIYFWNIDGYVQDHFRITPHLTIDYGVRFDHLSPWSDAHKLGLPVFDPAAYASRSNPVLPGIEWHAIDPSVPLSGVPAKWAYTEPRAGFAWDAYGNGQTIVRGGFGIYRSHDSSNDVTSSIGSVEGERNIGVNNLLLSSVSSQAATVTSAAGFTQGASPSALKAGDDEVPQVYTYNFAVDQKSVFNSFIEVAYVGNHVEHILNDGSGNTVQLANINALPIGALFQPNPTTGITLPLLAPTGTINNPNRANSISTIGQNETDEYRPFPLYHTLSVFQHNVYSNYNALQTQWNKQQGRATYGVNYTFSKVLGILGGGPNGIANGYPVDPFNYRDSYAPLAFDRTHIFNATYSYTTGRILENKLLGGLTNGWLVSGITNIQSGVNLVAQGTLPNFNLQGALAVLNQTGQYASLPISSQNFLGTPDVSLQPVVTGNPAIHTASHQYVNPASFSLPQILHQGTVRMPYIHGPAFTDTDLTAAKNFHIHESQSVQLRFAAFNFINHANSTFTTSTQPNALVLNYNNGNTVAANARPIATAIANAPEVNTFGLAPLRTGRRIAEMSVNYSF